MERYNYNFGDNEHDIEWKKKIQRGEKAPMVWLPQDADEEDMRYVEAFNEWLHDGQPVK